MSLNFTLDCILGEEDDLIHLRCQQRPMKKFGESFSSFRLSNFCRGSWHLQQHKSHKKLKYHPPGTSGDEDVKALKEIIEALGGWPILQGAAWDGSEWTMGNTVGKLRKILGHRTDKIFDIASFIIKLENANNVSPF